MRFSGYARQVTRWCPRCKAETNHKSCNNSIPRLGMMATNRCRRVTKVVGSRSHRSAQS